jgi:hypothetical protein
MHSIPLDGLQHADGVLEGMYRDGKAEDRMEQSVDKEKGEELDMVLCRSDLMMMMRLVGWSCLIYQECMRCMRCA